MAIDYCADPAPPRIVVAGVIGPEDVDQLYALVQEHPQVAVDLKDCEHLHTAALQLLLLAKVPVLSLPENTFWHHFFTLKEDIPHEDNFAG